MGFDGICCSILCPPSPFPKLALLLLLPRPGLKRRGGTLSGLDENDPSPIQDINEINILTRRFLRIHIKADDVYQAAHEFNNSMQDEGLKPFIRDTIIDIMKDDEIVENMASIKCFENSLPLEHVKLLCL